MKRIILFLVSISHMSLLAVTVLAGETLETRPSAPYEGLIIAETLAVFWIGIIGLVVIIRMKLREIERTQKMNLDKEEKVSPLLD
jgi:hypothetical protein